MLNYSISLIGLFALWFLTGLGASYFLTRGTPLFRYFVTLSIFFAQLLIVLSSTLLGTYQPGRISASMLVIVHGIGLILSATVVWKLGWRRTWSFARYRMTLPLSAILLTAVVLQVGPCLDRGQHCYISHINDENLNYSGSAQWATGQGTSDEFMFHWRETAHGRFGGDLLLAYVVRELSVPAIYAILPLQAMVKLQYLLSAVVFFHFLYDGSGLRRRWGGVVVALLLFISPLESENYLFAFLAHQTASAAMAIFCATMLLRSTGKLAVLQGLILVYLQVTYIEVIPVLGLLFAGYLSWNAWCGKTMRPLLHFFGVAATVLGSIYLRDPGLVTQYVFRLGTGGAGFNLLGDPGVAFWPYLAGLLSLRVDFLGAVFTSRPWLETLAVMAALCYLSWGLYKFGLLRRHYWILLIAFIVLAVHFDVKALVSSGKLRAISPIYAGPKAYIYFHFLWIGLIVSGAISSMKRGAMVWAGALLWALPVIFTGAKYIVRSQEWPAIWSAADDLALIAKIPPGNHLVVASNRPSEENLWRQLLVYAGSPAVFRTPAQPPGPSPVAYLLPRFWYSVSSTLGYVAVPLLGQPCSRVLGMSSGFILCADAPTILTTKIQLSGSLTDWDADIQPLVFCGQPGAAVFWALKNEGSGSASLLINEWGSPSVTSPSFPLVPNQPFEFTAHINRKAMEAALTSSGGATVSFKPGRPLSLGDCIPVVGQNPTDAKLTSKRFNGPLTARFQR